MAARFDVGTTVSQGNSETAVRRNFIKRWLISLSRPHCPGCKGEMVFRYKMPAEYQEVSPRYFTCKRCQACYCRTFGSAWTKVPAQDVPQA